MKLQTAVDTPPQSQIVTATGELVFARSASVSLQPSLPQQQTVDSSRTWVTRFLLAAGLGAFGGLMAAFALNPDTPPFKASLRSMPVVQPASAAAPSLIPPVQTTLVTVESPRKLHRALVPAGGEVDRLKVRNRRLEALVRVLRQRPTLPPSAGLN